MESDCNNCGDCNGYDTCPWREEVEGDTSECNCCDTCRQICAENI